MTREELGRVLHHEWRRWSIGEAGTDPDEVPGWEDESDSYREVCMREAGAVADAVRAEIAGRLAERVAELILGAAWPEVPGAEG